MVVREPHFVTLVTPKNRKQGAATLPSLSRTRQNSTVTTRSSSETWHGGAASWQQASQAGLQKEPVSPGLLQRSSPGSRLRNAARTVSTVRTITCAGRTLLRGQQRPQSPGCATPKTPGSPPVFATSLSDSGSPFLVKRSSSSPLPGLFRDLCDGSGCSIERVEERGITASQLRKLLGHTAKRCQREQWQQDGVRLTIRTVNLYQVVDNVIKPATRRRRCSFVELIADEAQPPLWFVSHWWGEAVCRFVLVVQQHAKDRHLPAHSPYWVCAYANNQWNLEEALLDDPEKSSFRKAVNLSVGTLSILDEASVCYKRMWCCFEIWVTLSVEHLQYDMYTVTSEGFAVGITDGIAPIDSCNGSDNEHVQKYERERLFPLQKANDAMSVRLQDAQASNGADRCYILNSIIGSPGTAACPPHEHDCYEELNTLLRARFAAAAWRNALEAGGPMDRYVASLHNSTLKQLVLDFTCSSAFTDEAAAQLAAALPESLEVFRLGLCGCVRLSNTGVKLLAAAFGNNLREVCLNLTRCEKLTDDALAALVRAIPANNICKLQLDLGSLPCITDSGLQCLAGLLCSAPLLEDLCLDMSYSVHLQDAPRILGSSLPRTLQKVRVVLVGCPWITSSDAESAIRGSLEGCDADIEVFADDTAI